MFEIDFAESRQVVRAIAKRETLGSTGIGHGCAVPHLKTLVVTRGKCCFMMLDCLGLDFRSFDGSLCVNISVYLGRPDFPGDMLRTTEIISRFFRNLDPVIRLEADEFLRSVTNAFKLVEGFVEIPAPEMRLNVTTD